MGDRELSKHFANGGFAIEEEVFVSVEHHGEFAALGAESREAHAFGIARGLGEQDAVGLEELETAFECGERIREMFEDIHEHDHIE